MKFVDEVEHAWRWVSVRCMAAAIALQTSWEVIPADLKVGFSDQHVRWVTVSLLVLGIMGRLVKQEKP